MQYHCAMSIGSREIAPSILHISFVLGGKAVPLEDHKDLSRRAIQMWASDNSEAPETIIAQNYINHQESDVEGGVSSRSLEAWKDLVGGYHSAFSNSKVKVLMEIAEGDLVAIRWEITATQTGDYMGLAPTN